MRAEEAIVRRCRAKIAVAAIAEHRGATLVHLDLDMCTNVTEEAKIELVKRCPALRPLSMRIMRSSGRKCVGRMLRHVGEREQGPCLEFLLGDLFSLMLGDVLW